MKWTIRLLAKRGGGSVGGTPPSLGRHGEAGVVHLVARGVVDVAGQDHDLRAAGHPVQEPFVRQRSGAPELDVEVDVAVGLGLVDALRVGLVLIHDGQGFDVEGPGAERGGDLLEDARTDAPAPG